MDFRIDSSKFRFLVIVAGKAGESEIPEIIRSVMLLGDDVLATFLKV